MDPPIEGTVAGWPAGLLDNHHCSGEGVREENLNVRLDIPGNGHTKMTLKWTPRLTKKTTKPTPRLTKQLRKILSTTAQDNTTITSDAFDTLMHPCPSQRIMDPPIEGTVAGWPAGLLDIQTGP